MTDFTEVTRRMEEFGLGSPTNKAQPPFRPAPIITEERGLPQRTYSMTSNGSDATTPSNSGKSTPINRKISQTRSSEEMYLLESPSVSSDASASPMNKRGCTPPTSPYVSQRDMMHPLTRKITGELGIASDVSKRIEKADFSDDDSASEGEEDDVIVLTDGEDNHNHTSSLLLDSSFDISPKTHKSDINCVSNNSSFAEESAVIAGSHHDNDDDEPFEFLTKSDHEHA